MVVTAVYEDLHGRSRASFFATPLAWATADLTGSLIANHRDQLDPHHTGLIVVSDECSLQTIRELRDKAAQGAISPMRFAGSSPSIVAGVAALEHGIRGPTLCLTMSPEYASAAVLALVSYWKGSNDISFVVVITHYPLGERAHLFKGVLLRPSIEDVVQSVQQLCHTI